MNNKYNKILKAYHNSVLNEGKDKNKETWDRGEWQQIDFELGFIENNVKRAKKLIQSKGNVFKIVSELKALEGSLKKAQAAIQKVRK